MIKKQLEFFTLSFSKIYEFYENKFIFIIHLYLLNSAQK